VWWCCILLEMQLFVIVPLRNNEQCSSSAVVTMNTSVYMILSMFTHSVSLEHFCVHDTVNVHSLC
jgi:hypothetical protein